MTKRTIVEQKVGDDTLRVTEMEFETLKEDWSEYRLENGTILRMKTIVGKIYHVVDDKDELAMMPDGDPFLMVRSKNEVVARKGGGD